MLKTIKRFFHIEKETSAEEINSKDLAGWLDSKFAALEFNNFLHEYFSRIAYLKRQLQEKSDILDSQQISEQDQKHVQDKVKNIVLGHRNHYVNEIKRFAARLSTEDKKYIPVSEYREILSFNRMLDHELEDLAKRTAKSYQAAQHLFFNNVENIFKHLGELNKLVKDFDQKVQHSKIKELLKVEKMILVFQQDIQKKKNLEKNIGLKKEELAVLSHQKRESDEKSATLKQSQEYKISVELKEDKKRLEQSYKEVEYLIFSFFSKLSKALKKYERVALENKLINKYLDDSVKAFLEDPELKILQVLQGLKKNLPILQFDEKHRFNFLELIEKSEQGYLQKSYDNIKSLQKDKQEIERKIKKNKIENEIEKTVREKEDLCAKIEKNKTETTELRTKLEKINIDDSKKELSEKMKNLFNVELKIISS